MLNLVTGTPGSGKTLLSIAEIQDRSVKEKRPVYYNGIKELKLAWIELDDPEKWYTVPVGSIIVLDEAQRIFRPRHYSSGVPEFVSRLETHRHEGLDVYLITQNPSLVDKNCRVLCGRHIHFVRQFGSQFAKRYEWMEYKDDVQSRSDAEMSLVAYPKDVFKLYKSAEVHTHKFKLPPSLLKSLLVFVLLPVVGFFAWRVLSNMGKGDVHSGAASMFGTPGGGAGGNASTGKIQTAHDFLAGFRPRVDGLDYTAPAFDKFTQVKSAPTPAGCAKSSSSCTCYTEQGTPLETAPQFCEAVVLHGVFRYWSESPSSRLTEGTDVHRTAVPPPLVASAEGRPVSVASGLAAVVGAGAAAVGQTEGGGKWIMP